MKKLNPNPNNEYFIDNLTTFIKLTDLWDMIKVDTEDIPLILDYKWESTLKKGKLYIRTRDYPNQTSCCLHRLIMGLDSSTRKRVIMFKNGDRKDFRKENLEIINKRQLIPTKPPLVYNEKPQEVYYNTRDYIGKYFAEYYVADLIKDDTYMCLNNMQTVQMTLSQLFSELRRVYYRRCCDYDDNPHYGKFIDADSYYLGPQLVPQVHPVDYPLNKTGLPKVITRASNPRTLAALGIDNIWFQSGYHIVSVDNELIILTPRTLNKKININYVSRDFYLDTIKKR